MANFFENRKNYVKIMALNYGLKNHFIMSN